jgi:hypothetical protein
MKQLFSFCALLLVAGAFLVGCDQDPNASGPDMRPMAAKGKPTPNANPAWVFPSSTFSKGKTYPSIAVSDVDGSDLIHVYLSPVSTNRPLFATWSPTGESVSFVDMPAIISNGWYSGTQWGNYTLNIVDVSISGGKVAGSNLRTIFSVTSADQMKIVAQAWCPATSGAGAGKIAFTVYTPTESRIYLVSENGGTPTLIYSTTNTDARIHGNSLTWSGDGTKLAFDQFSGTSTADGDLVYAIKIIDLSGAVLATLIDGSNRIGELQWSNAGLDMLTYESTPVDPPTSATSDDWKTYIIGTTAGSTPTEILSGTGNSYGIYWSPDNTELVYRYKDQSTYIYNIATATSTYVGQVPNGDWK